VARRDLGPDTLRELSDVLAASIRAGLDNREPALEYALQFGRGLDDELADRFVGMYVNELTEDYGEEGRRAVRELLRRGEEMPNDRRAERVTQIQEHPLHRSDRTLRMRWHRRHQSLEIRRLIDPVADPVEQEQPCQRPS